MVNIIYSIDANLESDEIVNIICNMRNVLDVNYIDTEFDGFYFVELNIESTIDNDTENLWWDLKRKFPVVRIVDEIIEGIDFNSYLDSIEESEVYDCA
jgi:hypothetical protein